MPATNLLHICLFIGLGLFLVLALYSFVIRGRHFKRLFSADHFKEVYDKTTKALIDTKMQLGDTFDPSRHEVAFTSTAGLNIMISDNIENGISQLHISVSDSFSPTTHAVGSRYCTFIAMILSDNAMDIYPFYTQTRVHHLAISHNINRLILRTFDDVYAQYSCRNYAPIHFAYNNIKGLTSR